MMRRQRKVAVCRAEPALAKRVNQGSEAGRRYARRDRGGGARRPMRDGVDDEVEAIQGGGMLGRTRSRKRRGGGMPGESEEAVGETDEAKARLGATVKSMLSRGYGVING